VLPAHDKTVGNCRHDAGLAAEAPSWRMIRSPGHCLGQDSGRSSDVALPGGAGSGLFS